MAAIEKISRAETIVDGGRTRAAVNGERCMSGEGVTVLDSRVRPVEVTLVGARGEDAGDDELRIAVSLEYVRDDPSDVCLRVPNDLHNSVRTLQSNKCVSSSARTRIRDFGWRGRIAADLRDVGGGGWVDVRSTA